MTTVFKTYHGKVIDDIADYVNGFIKKNHNNVDVLVGCDSQRVGNKKTKYCVSIILYVRGNGGHVLYTEETTPLERNIQVKIINEVWRAISVAQYLKEIGLDCTKFIDIDVNPDPRFGSNQVFKEVIGMVEGMGYKVRYKHNGAMASYTCDHLVRS